MTIVQPVLVKAGTSATIAAVRKVVSAVQQRINDKRLAMMVEQVAREFETDPTGAQEQILSALSSEWGYRLIEHTFRALMESIHTKAEVAIAAMMAEYLSDCRGPDREYQLAGGLLRAADEDLLIGLHSLMGQVLEISDHVDPETKRPDDRPQDEYTVLVGDESFWVFRMTRKSSQYISSGAAVPTSLNIVLRLMDRNELGRIRTEEPVSSGKQRPNGEHIFGMHRYYFTPDDIPRIARLHAYITVSLADPCKWDEPEVIDE